MQEHDWPDKPTGRELKTWYLGHDEAKARLLAAQLQKVWEIRKDAHFSG